MEKILRDQITALIKREVVPAIGCTEPMAVALCTARATEKLGTCPERMEAFLSANILKNAMGVGIPGTGMVGLPIAIALGALVGKSSYGLEVLKDNTPEITAQAKEYIASHSIDIKLKADAPDNLYIEVHTFAESREESATIAYQHTRFLNEDEDGNENKDAHKCGNNYNKNEYPSKVAKTTHAADQPKSTPAPTSQPDIELNLRLVYDYATTTPIEELEFINEARRLNQAAADEALRGNYGHNLGKTLSRPLGRGIMGESIFSHMLSATSAACDARMAGAMVPVMSNSGSGNQGIAATMPVVTFAQENHNTEEELTRALILSHLTAIYIKQSLGRLSALCGCVVACTGSSCGLTYLMGGNYDKISYAVKNMIANLAGMVCDGAKPSCALKVSSGVSTAALSAMLAIQNHFVTSDEGLIDDDVDASIHNLTRIGHDGMKETDRLVLDIMTHKGQC